MKNILQILILLLLQSCVTSNKFIVIYPDSSATVQTTAKVLPENVPAVRKKIMQSKTIQVTDTTGLIEFEIARIDSIGNYFIEFNEGYFDFEFKNDSTFIIRTTDVEPFEFPEFEECCHIYLDIYFEKMIKNVVTDTKRIKWKKNQNKITFMKSISNMRNKNENVFIEVTLKDKLTDIKRKEPKLVGF